MVKESTSLANRLEIRAQWREYILLQCTRSNREKDSEQNERSGEWERMVLCKHFLWREIVWQQPAGEWERSECEIFRKARWEGLFQMERENMSGLFHCDCILGYFPIRLASHDSVTSANYCCCCGNFKETSSHAQTVDILINIVQGWISLLTTSDNISSRIPRWRHFHLLAVVVATASQCRD